MKAGNRPPGWDKQVVNRIAKGQYGGLTEMFEVHGWTTDGRVISQIAPTKVVQTYGSVDAFEIAHQDGLDANFIVSPQAAVIGPNPRVLLTSAYGFDPIDWPCLTFTDLGRAKNIIADSRPGFFAVVYGSISSRVPSDMRGRIIGLMQLTHQLDETDAFLSPVGRARKAQIQLQDSSWKYAFRALRAWRVAPEYRPDVASFASTTYSPDRGRSISRFGAWLTPAEATGILDLELIAEPLFGTDVLIEPILKKGSEAIAPSRPGPVSQNPFMVRESEGPKYLYILQLHGVADHFLGRESGGRSIIKVGFSKSPATRCLAFNRVMPEGAFRWSLLKSTRDEGLEPYATSRLAMAREQAMIKLLVKTGDSLGGEFFLADEAAIAEAWALGKSEAGKHKK